AFDGARGHDAGDGAGEGTEHGDEALAMQADLAHEAIHEKRGARHVPGVLEQADEKEEEQNLGQKYDHGADTGDDTVHQKTAKITRGNLAGDKAADPMHECLDSVHRHLGEGEDALEHDGHDGDEHERAPELVGEDAVEAVAEGFLVDARLGDDLLMNGHDGAVAGFDGRGTPVHTGDVETGARGFDGVEDVGGIMFETGGEGLFIAEQQERLGGGLKAMFAKAFGQKAGERFNLGIQRLRQLSKAGRGEGGIEAFLERRKNLFAQLRNSPAGAGDERHDRNAKPAGERSDVDVMAVFLGDIDHVERDDRGVAEFDDLRRVVEIALEIGGVDDDNDERGRGQFRETMQQHVAGDLFVEGLRAEAVGAGEIEHLDGGVGGRVEEAAFLAFDGDAGVIADLGAEAG